MRVRTQIYIEKAQRARLRRRAKERGGRATVSEIIREAIDFYLGAGRAADHPVSVVESPK